ncbi:MAG: DnaJ domain-containing protein [Acidobacteriota bacterium]|nr:DnaJ domain-containing protein [Acidobacteriota bacterium]MDW3228257.1 DnaJ domain-containing protein [Acidobacteriota bacterium]MDY0231484.1 DnaJ domain-containing protein [Candidatus Saccharicenans sp.]
MSTINHIGRYLKEVFFNNKTGRLSFKRGEIEKHFFFIKGKPFQVKTNLKSERLGEILFKLQKIQEQTFSHIEDYIQPDQPLGQSLQHGGLIKEADLREALAFQIRESLLETFNYFNGEISFQEKDFWEPPEELPTVDVPWIIDYGLRRMKYDSAIEKFFTGRKIGLKNIRCAYFLTEDEKSLLERFSTPQIIGQMAVPADFSKEDFYRCLYLFYCLDMIELTTADSSFKKDDHEEEGKKKLELDELEARIEELKEIKSQLKNRNYYELLGISRAATVEEIKTAYFNLARKYHPDRFNTNLSDYSLVNEVFNALNSAYRTLIDPGKRSRYDQQLSATTQESPDDLSRRAEVKYRQGRTLYNQGMYEEAVIFLEEAIRLKRAKADYYLLLAMAESKLPAYQKKAEEDFLRAIEMEPWNAEGYLGLGLLYLGEGLKIKAKKQLQKALEIDPDHHQARIALQEIEKGQKKPGLKSLLDLNLSDLFKKKK